jgi:hypothetical protein
VSFAAVTLCVDSLRVFIVVVYFVIDSVRKNFDTPSYVFETASLNGISNNNKSIVIMEAYFLLCS